MISIPLSKPEIDDESKFSEATKCLIKGLP